MFVVEATRLQTDKTNDESVGEPICRRFQRKHRPPVPAPMPH